MMGRVLTVILALIGIGSFLFHTFAQTWAGLADVLPILMFILVYIYVATRDYFTPHAGIVACRDRVFSFAAVIGWLILDWEFLGSTRGYVPVPILILIYAYLLRRKLPDVARVEHGVGILVASMGARWADEPLCHMHPIGTHFLWHILNAVMLAWMIEVYRRHMLAGSAPSVKRGQTNDGEPICRLIRRQQQRLVNLRASRLRKTRFLPYARVQHNPWIY